MNKTVDWKTVAELVGIAAIVASILFLAVQIQQSQEIAESERGYSSLENRMALSLAIADHAAIWNAGNAGQELDEVEATVYANLIESLHWVHWSAWRSADKYELITTREIVATDFAGFLHWNPGALHEWRRYLSLREPMRKSLVAGYERNQFQDAVEQKLVEMADN